MADRRNAALAVGFALAAIGCKRQPSKPSHVTTVDPQSTVLPKVSYAPAKTIATAQTIDVDGVMRDYLLVAPERFDPGTKLPLVLAFHGDGGEPAAFHESFPFEAASGARAFVAYPSGRAQTWDLETTDGNRDVAFVEALVDALARRLPIDRARVYATGYSSGGFFSNLLACQRSKLIRAIASSAGGAPYKQAEAWPNGFTRCPGEEPVAALVFHGDIDDAVTLDSGRFSASYWAYVDGCDGSAMETTGYPECQAYVGCRPGKSVAWCEIADVGHWVWKSAAEASWTFFERVSRTP